jgi:hypothetical protein
MIRLRVALVAALTAGLSLLAVPALLVAGPAPAAVAGPHLPLPDGLPGCC